MFWSKFNPQSTLQPPSGGTFAFGHDQPVRLPLSGEPFPSRPPEMEPANSEAEAIDWSPLVDRFGRTHRSLRISVIDACNIRCQYCMPAEGVQFLKQHRLLSFDAIVRLVEICVRLGIHKYRVTGGEPLLRPQLAQLLKRISNVQGVHDLALTTNGMLLDEQISELERSGLQRINISLDTLSDARFQQLTRREGLDRVLAGIDAALDSGRFTVKLNALILRDINLEDVPPLVGYARRRGIDLRFIEFMPLDGDRAWNDQRMVSGAELRAMLQEHFGPLTQVARDETAQPAGVYRFADGTRVGFIDSVSAPFCGACDRLRLTADGKLRNCLFGSEEWDLTALLNQAVETPGEEMDQRIVALLRQGVSAKHAAHGIADPDFHPPARAMYQIGG
jgi:GTP 3',8-cyclase